MSVRAEAEAALKQAQRAAKRGDLAAADRWSKTAERLSLTLERLGLAGEPPEDSAARAAEEEKLRTEFIARLQRLADAAYQQQQWEAEREERERLAREAIKTGAPPPPALRERPYTDRQLEKLAEAVGRGDD